MHRVRRRRCECLLRPSLDGVLRTCVHDRICSGVHNRVCPGRLSSELRRRLVSRLLVGPRDRACLGFALDICCIVSVCLWRELRSRLLWLLDLFCRLRTLQLMLDLHRQLRAELLDLRSQRCSLQLVLDVCQLRTIDVLELLGRACGNANVVHGPGSAGMLVMPGQRAGSDVRRTGVLSGSVGSATHAGRQRGPATDSGCGTEADITNRWTIHNG
jgi:hypothetical protein